MKVADAAKTLRERTDVRELAQRLRPSLAWRRHGHELCAPCPMCHAGEDRFYVGATYAACRQCHPARMDAAGLVAWLEDVPMHEAVRRLDANALEPVTSAATVTLDRQKEEQDEQRREQWRRDAIAGVEPAHERLLRSPAAAQARSYLLARGLTPATWSAFLLGYVSGKRLPKDREQTAPVVSWPVYDEVTGDACAVRYRFVTETPTGDRYTSAGSTRGRLFGAQLVREYLDGARDWYAEGRRCLVLVEGELNAMSVHQACSATGVDALSTCSEAQWRLPAWCVELASRYGAVLTWFDKPETAAQVAQQIPRALPVRSPVQDGKKVDANDMLVSGVLGAFVQTLRARALPDDHARECALWQIWDVRDEVDAGTVAAGRKLARALGRTW